MARYTCGTVRGRGHLTPVPLSITITSELAAMLTTARVRRPRRQSADYRKMHKEGTSECLNALNWAGTAFGKCVLIVAGSASRSRVFVREWEVQA